MPDSVEQKRSRLDVLRKKKRLAELKAKRDASNSVPINTTGQNLQDTRQAPVLSDFLQQAQQPDVTATSIAPNDRRTDTERVKDIAIAERAKQDFIRGQQQAPFLFSKNPNQKPVGQRGSEEASKRLSTNDPLSIVPAFFDLLGVINKGESAPISFSGRTGEIGRAHV